MAENKREFRIARWSAQHCLSLRLLERVIQSRLVLLLLLAYTVPSAPASERKIPASKPNILLIAIDDLNDWVGCLGGHPQAVTPNIDRLAAKGTLFSNAHCQAPVCQPSRASLLTSTYPSSSGLYFLNPGIDASPVTKQKTTIFERFARDGYTILGAGKIFHVINGPAFNQLGKYGGGFGYFGPQPDKKISQPHGHPLWDWGAYPDSTDQMPDARIAKWAIEQLRTDNQDPLFLAIGFYRPHVPMLVPKKWFDQHPRTEILTPVIHPGDVDDLSPYARDLTSLQHVAPLHQWILKNSQWQHAIQAYLACCSFVDACVGEILDALDCSSRRDNTIIVLFSDHGFHLGEKERWAKRSLWEDGTRVPLIIVGPGLPEHQVCPQPVGLIDIYPTLLELCGLPPDHHLEGISLLPQLKDPSKNRTPARTTFGPGNHAIRSRDWRYIRYRDGSEELYDHRNDPHEWDNLAKNPKHQEVLQRHREYLPTTEHPVLGAGSTGHQAFLSSEKKRLRRKQAP